MTCEQEKHLVFLACFSDGPNLIIQPQKYIEGVLFEIRWFIKVVEGMYEVYKMPQYGGKPHHLRDFVCAESAIKYARNLA